MNSLKNVLDQVTGIVYTKNRKGGLEAFFPEVFGC